MRHLFSITDSITFSFTGNSFFIILLYKLYFQNNAKQTKRDTIVLLCVIAAFEGMYLLLVGVNLVFIKRVNAQC